MKRARLLAIASCVLMATTLAATARAQQPLLRTAAQDGAKAPEAPQGSSTRATATTSTVSESSEAAAATSTTTTTTEASVYEGELGEATFGHDIWNCCHSCCCAGLIGGFEATYLAPIGEPDQEVILTDLVTNRTYDGTSDPGLGMGFRTWLGIQHCGWGFRVRYWHMGNNDIETDPDVPEVHQDAFTAFNQSFHLDADVLDVEVTQKLCFGCWSLYASFGGRYAELDRQSLVFGYGQLSGVELTGLAMGSNLTEGAGFTFSLGGKKPIFCCCHGCGHGCGCQCGHCGYWHVFWNVRGSYLWADSRASALTQATAVVKTGAAAAVATSRDKALSSKEHSESLFVGEIQVGMQYEKCLCCLPATFFFRGALEYQHWDTGDTFAKSGSFAFLEGTPPPFGGRVDATADAHDGDLQLIGVTFATGLTY